MMFGRSPSLRRRLTLFYTALFGCVIFTSTVAIAYIAFANSIRPQATDLATTTRDVEALVAAAPRGESTADIQKNVVAATRRRDVTVIPISIDLREHSDHRPPGYLKIFNLFGVFPAFVGLREAAVVIVPEPTRLDVFYRSFVTTVVSLAIFSIVVGWFLARLAARQTLRPLLLVTAELRRFESGDFSPRSTMKTDLTEFGDLAAAYNGAAAQVTAALIERRRVEEQIRQFVSEAGHELRTPLTVVAGYVDVLRRGGDGDPQVRAMSFESLGFELKRMRALVERLMTLARLDRPLESHDEIVDMRAMVGQAIDAVSITSHVAIRYRSRDGCFVRGEAGDVYEATANLLENAIKYGEGSDIDVALERSGREIVVRVCDGGPGIAQEHRARIFERFYRATEHREIAGSGLGLAIAAKAAERLRGRLELQDGRPKSTTFALIVPALHGTSFSH